MRHRVGEIVNTSPPGVTLCVDGKYSTGGLDPGVCSYHGGWMRNYPEQSKTLQNKAKRRGKKPSALVLPDESAPEQETSTATLTFPTREQAQTFGKAWARYSLRGYDMTSGITNVDVTIYDVTAEDKIWIDNYLGSMKAEPQNQAPAAPTMDKGLVMHSNDAGQYIEVATIKKEGAKYYDLSPSYLGRKEKSEVFPIDFEVDERLQEYISNVQAMDNYREIYEELMAVNRGEKKSDLYFYVAAPYLIPGGKRINSKLLKNDLSQKGYETLMPFLVANLKAPMPAPPSDPEEDVTDGPHYRIDAKRKAELHLGYDYYKSLPQDTKKEIKRYFTWGRGRQAWVSKGKYDSMSVQNIIKMLDLPLAGKDERMTFSERMERQKSNAEYRAGRLEKSIERSEKRQEELQAEFNERRKDWSWVTQPNIVDSAAGRAFTNQRNRVLRRYEKGFEEAQRREELYNRMQNALTTAQQEKLEDPDYLQRKIKENAKSVKIRTEQLEKLQKTLNQPEEDFPTIYQSGERKKATREDLLDIYERTLEIYQEAGEKVEFFQEALDRLKEQGVKVFNKENLKGAAYVKIKGDWYKVIRVSAKSVTIKYDYHTWRLAHSRIEDAVYKGDDFEVTPTRNDYTYNITKRESISGPPTLFRSLRVLNL